MNHHTEQTKEDCDEGKHIKQNFRDTQEGHQKGYKSNDAHTALAPLSGGQPLSIRSPNTAYKQSRRGLLTSTHQLRWILLEA